MGSEDRWTKWRELLTRGRPRERWSEKDATCPRCGGNISAYYPMQMGLRRAGLYVADPKVKCPECGWSGTGDEARHKAPES